MGELLIGTNFDHLILHQTNCHVVSTIIVNVVPKIVNRFTLCLSFGNFAQRINVTTICGFSCFVYLIGSFDRFQLFWIIIGFDFQIEAL